MKSEITTAKWIIRLRNTQKNSENYTKLNHDIYHRTNSNSITALYSETYFLRLDHKQPELIVTQYRLTFLI